MNAEIPDFDAIAREAYTPHSGDSTEDDFKAGVAAIAEQLRQIWNRRGAADAHAVEHRLSTLTGWVTSEPYRQHLQDAIAALDRRR